MHVHNYILYFKKEILFKVLKKDADYKRFALNFSIDTKLTMTMKKMSNSSITFLILQDILGNFTKNITWL